ncbi:hypothetical protein MKW98_005862 [Papaver atlanticum]|uniref:Uncharacterized protein n=1 Tax=Papaver atlanticum TaxID=357466 RepID=A0AAD4XVY5_9MAGN|nr:hypothetical protein MKW98_005862 [Papaver atlanticum]
MQDNYFSMVIILWRVALVFQQSHCFSYQLLLEDYCTAMSSSSTLSCTSWYNFSSVELGSLSVVNFLLCFWAMHAGPIYIDIGMQIISPTVPLDCILGKCHQRSNTISIHPVLAKQCIWHLHQNNTIAYTRRILSEEGVHCSLLFRYRIYI